MKIAITQRVELIKDYGETRDCLDVDFAEFLEEVGMIAVPIPSHIGNVTGWINEVGIEGILLTGGNDLSHLSNASNPSIERDDLERKLIDYAIKNSTPLIGICRGMQHINYYFEGKMHQVENHVAVRHIITKINDKEERTVNSFHNWAISKTELADELKTLYYDEDYNVEAFQHRDHKIFGMMWHPEREKPFDEKDLNTIIEIYKDKK